MQQRINHCPATIVFGAILGPASVATVANCQSIQSQLAAEQNWKTVPVGGEVARPADNAALAHWWTVFNDPVLSSLEERALKTNLDLRTALSSIEQARANLLSASGSLLPSVTITGTATGVRASTRSGGQVSHSNAAEFDASWEPDFFGSRRKTVAAYDADIQTAQENLRNTMVSRIQIGVRYGSDTKLVQNEVVTLMRQRRSIQPGQEDDFSAINSQEFLTTLTSTMQILTALLGAIAAISLLVGGIGIMNIMLVSVTERTREIGIRLAIGAFDNDVMIQFLVEAVVLASLGGIIGITLGLAASFVGCLLMKAPFSPNMSIAAIAFVFSAMVGVVFGFFPAQKAARLDPIKALRHE